MFPREVASVAALLRPELRVRDAVRDVPGRVHRHRLDASGEERGAGEVLAGDDPHPERIRPVLDERRIERGDVDEEVAFTEIVRHPAPALEIPADLAKSGLTRNVQFGERFRARDAILDETVPALEVAHCCIELRVERSARGPESEPRAQLRNPRLPVPGPQ